MVGTGIGAAFQVGGLPLLGAKGWAGELGYMPIYVDGEGGHALGVALAAVINLLNPVKLAIGGGTFALHGYAEAAYKAAQRYSLPDLWDTCSLEEVKSFAIQLIAT
jgi:predicted NBD/HSP70 family sugar kinase